MCHDRQEINKKEAEERAIKKIRFEFEPSLDDSALWQPVGLSSLHTQLNLIKSASLFVITGQR